MFQLKLLSPCTSKLLSNAEGSGLAKGNEGNQWIRAKKGFFPSVEIDPIQAIAIMVSDHCFVFDTGQPLHLRFSASLASGVARKFGYSWTGGFASSTGADSPKRLACRAVMIFLDEFLLLIRLDGSFGLGGAGEGSIDRPRRGPGSWDA